MDGTGPKVNNNSIIDIYTSEIFLYFPSFIQILYFSGQYVSGQMHPENQIKNLWSAALSVSLSVLCRTSYYLNQDQIEIPKIFFFPDFVFRRMGSLKTSKNFISLLSILKLILDFEYEQSFGLVSDLFRVFTVFQEISDSFFL